MNKERIKIMRIAASVEVDECLDEIERFQKALLGFVDVDSVLEEPVAAPEVIVRMEPGENPKVFDSNTGEDLSNLVAEIRILPGRRAVATMYKLDEDGKRIIESGAWVHFNAPIMRIQGVWDGVTGSRNEEIQLGDPAVQVVRPDFPVKVRPE